MGQPTRQGETLMAKDTDEVRQDRTSDRTAIQQQMDDYLRDGGLISKLDWAGNVVGLATEAVSAPKHVAKVLPFKAPEPVAAAPAPKTIVFPVPAPTGKRPPAKPLPVKTPAPAPTAVVIDIVPELRRIREDARRALARLNAAAERRTA